MIVLDSMKGKSIDRKDKMAGRKKAQNSVILETLEVEENSKNKVNSLTRQAKKMPEVVART